MPYKDKHKYAEAMRRHRAKRKQQMTDLKLKYPDAYEIIFGSKKKGRRR